MASSVPESFICPISQEIMTDPVIDPEGNSYERSAILDWLASNPSSPITKTPLRTEQLRTNKGLRDLIQNNRGDDAPPAYTAEDPVAGLAGLVKAVALPSEEKKQDENAIGLSLFHHRVSDTEVLIEARALAPVGTERTPVDVVCVVDVSGSMGINATVQNEQGATEKSNLTILDITKHAVKTIIGTLNATDRLSIVSYSTAATKVLDLTSMTAAGKTRATASVERLRADGQTNLWMGLQTGLDTLKSDPHPGNRVRTVLLLTDGQPNIVPPRGHIDMLKRYMEKDANFSCQINTFGFGYNLDSPLLRQLADYASGMYAFIPDSGFVGTTFVHSISNVLATCAKDVKISISNTNGIEVMGTQLSNLGKDDAAKKWANLGSLQYGQSRSVVFKATVPVGTDVTFNATMDYQPWNSATPLSCNSRVSVASAESPKEAAEVEVQGHRLLAASLIESLVPPKIADFQQDVASAAVTALVARIKASPTASTVAVKDLLQDLEGQVVQAVSRVDWFKKWGCHYLPSLARAHFLQQPNNFKDPGIQHYGGKLFQEMRDMADDVFMALPPPAPEQPEENVGGYGGGYSMAQASAAPARPVDMSMFNNRGAGCFAGHCRVLMADGRLKRVDRIRKGDLLSSCDGAASVRCVVQAQCQGGVNDMVQLPGGLCLTPYHPVRVEKSWHFPLNLAGEDAVRLLPCPVVYNFVLDQGHIMNINGVECVTLGHDFTDDVVAHPYFGSQKVVEDLQQMHRWVSGTVRFGPGCLLRDPSTGLITKYDPAAEI